MNSKIFVLAIGIVAAFGVAGVGLATVAPVVAQENMTMGDNMTMAGNMTGGNMTTGDNITLTG